MKVMLALLGVAIGLSGVSLAVAQDGDAPKPKYTIKEVMVQGHKDGLLKKILAGDGTQDDKLKLLDLYISLIENDPPQGDMESWQILSGKAALAAAKVATGREGSLAELKTATNCAACHKVHKPE